MAVVKRAHRFENISPALVRLRAQVDAAFPNRSRVSDGIWPSPAHTAKNPNSDHEAGNALDITFDLGNGRRAQELFDAIKASGDSRVKYMIHRGRIWSPGKGDRQYTGSNPHESHVHISVEESKRALTRDWAMPQPPKKATAPKPKEATVAQIDDFDLRVKVRPEKYQGLAKYLADNNIFADGVKYENGRPVSFAVNPVPHRIAKK